MNSTAAIFDRLTADAAIRAALAGWQGGAAIFSERAPDDFLDTPPTKPFLIIAVPTRDEPMETFTETGRVIQQDVRGYQRDTGSGADLDTLMRSIRDLFHNRPDELTVTGGKCDVCRVNGPMQSPTSDDAYIGRRITIRLDLVQA